MACDKREPYCSYVLNGKGDKGSPKKRKQEIGKPDRKNSPDWAFVVQFIESTEPGSVRFAGRAEHVMSGESTGFERAEELVDFFGRVLKQLKP